MTTPNRTTFDIFIENFEQALFELLECYVDKTLSTTSKEASTTEHDLSAIVGFCDEFFRGSVALSSTNRIVESQFHVSSADAPDWLGEMCNQLVGRLKNKLSVFGLQPKLSTPTSVSGRLLKVCSLVGDACAVRIHWDGGDFTAQMALELDDELVLVAREELEPMTEGSMHLF